jgi:hypothetical protein
MSHEAMVVRGGCLGRLDYHTRVVREARGARHGGAAYSDGKVATLGFRVEMSSRRRFATSADFRLHDCCPGTEGYTHDAIFWGVVPRSRAPCQTLVFRFATFSSLYAGGPHTMGRHRIRRGLRRPLAAQPLPARHLRRPQALRLLLLVRVPRAGAAAAAARHRANATRPGARAQRWPPGDQAASGDECAGRGAEGAEGRERSASRGRWRCIVCRRTGQRGTRRGRRSGQKPSRRIGPSSQSGSGGSRLDSHPNYCVSLLPQVVGVETAAQWVHSSARWRAGITPAAPAWLLHRAADGVQVRSSSS